MDARARGSRSARAVRPTGTSTRQRRAVAGLSTAALRRLDESLPWYRAMEPEDRSWVGLVAQAGIRAFTSWFASPAAPLTITADVFGTAPRELTRSISLRQTLELVRAVVDVVEDHVEALTDDPDDPRQLAAVKEAVLRYSREVAFAAAEVYAQAAETRGAWDARLEALVVDALLRGDTDDALQSRVAALGWHEHASVTVVVGANRPGPPEQVVDDLRRAARTAADDALVGVQGDRVVVVLGTSSDPSAAATNLAPRFGPGPVVVGPTVTDLPGAGYSARVALAGLVAARAWPAAPRPVDADDLLPERVLSGDVSARRALLDRVYHPLQVGRSRPGGDRGGLPGERPVPRGHRTHAVRAPEHGPLPPAPGRRGDGLGRDPSARRLRPAGRAGHRAARRATDRSWRNPPTFRLDPCPVRSPIAVHPHGKVETCSSSSAPARGPRAPASSPRGWSCPASASGSTGSATVAGLDLVAHGTTSDADTIRDTAVAQPLIVGAGLVSLLALFPHPADAFAVIAGGAGHSVGEITAASAAGVISAEQAMVFVRERGRAMAEASAVTPTGMSAVVGGDPDEVLAALDQHGLTPANVNGAGPGRGRRHHGAARRPRRRRRRPRPASSRCQVAGAFHTRHMARRPSTCSAATRARCRPTTRGPCCCPTPTAPSSTTVATC